MAGLLNSYSVSVDEDAAAVLYTEDGASGLHLVMYPASARTAWAR